MLNYLKTMRSQGYVEGYRSMTNDWLELWKTGLERQLDNSQRLLDRAGDTSQNYGPVQFTRDAADMWLDWLEHLGSATYDMCRDRGTTLPLDTDLPMLAYLCTTSSVNMERTLEVGNTTSAYALLVDSTGADFSAHIQLQPIVDGQVIVILRPQVTTNSGPSELPDGSYNGLILTGSASGPPKPLATILAIKKVS